jgi:hypothetical protein
MKRQPQPEWKRNILRNKSKKPPKPCTCSQDGINPSCKVKFHSDRAKILQSVGLNPLKWEDAKWNKLHIMEVENETSNRIH